MRAKSFTPVWKLPVFLLGWVMIAGPVEANAAEVSKNMLVDGAAMVSDWVPPVYPPEALKEMIGGPVVVRIIVDAEGKITAARVLNPGDARLGEAALTAIKQWTFSPAMEGGKRVACCLDVPFAFDAGKGAKSWRKGLMPDYNQMPAVATGTGAVPKTTPAGEYPATLKARKLPGWVRFALRVDAEGRPGEPKILGASHGDFVLPAVAALARWEFTPAKQGDLTVAAEVTGEVTFDDFGGKRGTVLAANGLTGPDGAEAAAFPELISAIDPVTPVELLLRGVGGEAVVEFTVGTDGSVADLKLRSASQPEFGGAALAALESWSFRPGVKDGRFVPVTLQKKVEFAAVPLDAAGEAPSEWVALVRALRADKVGEARGLDERLTPWFRVSPIYPEALRAAGRPAGSAEIEFVIARDGRARLPRIVTATHEALGWAAATAIGQWVFKAPRRDGQPVEVKVRIPVTFSPPGN